MESCTKVSGVAPGTFFVRGIGLLLPGDGAGTPLAVG